MKNLASKFLLTLAIIFATSFTVSLTTYTSASADCRPLLGLTSWDCGVNITDQDTLKAGIWQIAVNVATDITVIAAYLVLGYVIYGGYLYTFSGGDPSKVATGKRALSQAFIGLAIVMLANVIMNSIRFALLGASGVLNGNAEVGSLVVNAIHWSITIAGIISAIFVVYGGISYITSSGDPSKIQKAKQTILYALIGLTIVTLAEIITSFVTSMIRDAAYTNQTFIAKEVYEINKSN